MVTIEEDGEGIQLILRPDRSLSWRGNQYLLTCMGLWLGSFAVAFAAMGAWVVLPFVGIELLALAAALYYVSWKLSHCQALRITADQIHIAQGTSYPRESWVLPRANAVVHVSAAPHPWSAPAIYLMDNRVTTVQIGEFLTRQDAAQLLQQLVSAGLATRRSHGRIEMAF